MKRFGRQNSCNDESLWRTPQQQGAQDLLAYQEALVLL